MSAVETRRANPRIDALAAATLASAAMPPRSSEARATAVALAILAALTLLPHPSLLTLDAVHVPDDLFVSDLFGGELPLRASVGRMLRAGELPVWEPSVYGGAALLGIDLLGALCFGLISRVAAALDVFLLVVLLGAAGSAFVLARRLGASRSGAVLAGFAWAHSGVMATQLRHIGVVATFAWTPLALALLDRALEPASQEAPWDPSERRRRLAAFALVVGLQALGGFPQALLVAVLAYGAWTVARLAAWPRDPRGRLVTAPMAWLVAGFAVACITGFGIGAATLLPIRDAALHSERTVRMTAAFAPAHSAWLSRAFGLLSPHARGDASDGTYRDTDLFWESYAYVGLATALLAAFALFAGRRRRVERTLALLGIAAFLVSFGASTPLYRVAWEHVRTLRSFGLPTRFLFLVDVALVTLAALGLTHVERWYARRTTSPLRARVLAAGIVALVVLDLCAAQRRQNPFVDGASWLAPPESARTLRREANVGRIVSLGAAAEHLEVYNRVPGWQSLAPFFAQRESLEPNTPALWGFDAADGYFVFPGRGPLFFWGRYGVLGSGAAARLHHAGPRTVTMHPMFARLLAMQGVTHVLSPVPLDDARFVRVPSASSWRVHRVPDPLGRAWFVDGVEPVHERSAALARALEPGFDPRRTVLLRDAPPGIEAVPATGDAPGAVVHWRREAASRIAVTVDAPRAGWVVLAETWHPEWEVTVDGQRRPSIEAHVTGQAVRVDAGRHVLRWRFRGRAVRRGVALSLAFAVATGLALRGARRSRGSSPDRRGSSAP